MKWITRERAKVDRVACPWLISRFLDPTPEFFYVPADQVLDEAEGRGAIPYDVAGVELGHQGPFCSFDALLRKYGLRVKTRHSTVWPSSCAGRIPPIRTLRPSPEGSMPSPVASR